MRLVEDADVVVENMRAAGEAPPEGRYDDVKAVNPRIVYGSISGFGQTGPYGHRAGVDQIAQGMGGLMSITGLPGPGPGARRHPDRRSDRRQSAGARHHDGALRPRAHRRRPLGADQPARSADLHAGLPGLALADGRRGGAAGRQRPPDRHPDRRVPDQRRPHQHRRQLRPAVGTGSATRSASRSGRTTRTGRTRRPRSSDRKAINAAIGEVTRHKPSRALDRAVRRRRHSRAGRSTRSTRCSPIRRCSISAWRRRCIRRWSGTWTWWRRRST